MRLAATSRPQPSDPPGNPPFRLVAAPVTEHAAFGAAGYSLNPGVALSGGGVYRYGSGLVQSGRSVVVASRPVSQEHYGCRSDRLWRMAIIGKSCRLPTERVLHGHSSEEDRNGRDARKERSMKASLHLAVTVAMVLVFSTASCSSTREHTRTRRTIGAIVGGTGLIAAGLGGKMFIYDCPHEYDGCSFAPESQREVAGTVLGAGVVLLVVGAALVVFDPPAERAVEADAKK